MRKEKECIRIALHANHRRAKQVLRTPLCTRITRRTASVSNFHLLRTRQCRQQSMCFLFLLSLSHSHCVSHQLVLFSVICACLCMWCVCIHVHVRGTHPVFSVGCWVEVSHSSLLSSTSLSHHLGDIIRQREKMRTLSSIEQIK